MRLNDLIRAVALCLCATGAWAEEDPGGQMRAIVDGAEVSLPLLKTDIDAQINGDLATVTVRQIFENPTRTPLNATYLFPLNTGAAVHAMTMQVGDEMIEAVIQEKQQAQATFDKAKSEGKAASLLVQHRPNMFTQNIANLMPGLPVTVTLKYVQAVPRIDGAYELVVPLIVGPRYEGAQPANLPEYPGVAGLTLPKSIASDRVSIHADLRAPMPVAHVHSATHRIDVTGSDARRVSLTKGAVIDNRDFVLRYDLAGANVQAGALTHRDDRGGVLSLMIEPPKLPDPATIRARELVFVLDTSGSMGGAPIEASKAFMQHALKALRPTDYFRIIRFSNTAEAYSQDAQPATPAALRKAGRFVNGLNTGGGTEIARAIRTAFAAPQPADTLRIVVFLSDGYIGDEATVLATVDQLIGKARIYAFGVGTSVNRYLLEEMAQVGRGFVRYVDPTETGLDAAQSLAGRLESPLLTNLTIDWGDLAITDPTPAKLPDLFAGDAVRVLARFTGDGSHSVAIRGMAQGQPVTLPIRLDLPKTDTKGTEALALIWARARIADLMRRYAIPSDVNRDVLRDRITALGLRYALVTEWTSFVAVSKKIVNRNPDGSVDTAVPLPQVKGVPATAYPDAVTGSSAPEPAETAGMILLALILGLWLYRERAKVA